MLIIGDPTKAGDAQYRRTSREYIISIEVFLKMCINNFSQGDDKYLKPKTNICNRSEIDFEKIYNFSLHQKVGLVL